MTAGPRVIGQEAYDALVKVRGAGAMALGGPTAGPRIIGRAEYDRRLKERQTQTVQPPAAAAPEGEGFVLSIEELGRTLAKNPEFIDDLIVAELSRTAGPRKEALLALKHAEVRHQKRAKILAQIDDLLEPET